VDRRRELTPPSGEFDSESTADEREPEDAEQRPSAK
jgi:hypothetical protein